MEERQSTLGSGGRPCRRAGRGALRVLCGHGSGRGCDPGTAHGSRRGRWSPWFSHLAQPPSPVERSVQHRGLPGRAGGTGGSVKPRHACAVVHASLQSRCRCLTSRARSRVPSGCRGSRRWWRAGFLPGDGRRCQTRHRALLARCLLQNGAFLSWVWSRIFQERDDKSFPLRVRRELAQVWSAGSVS